MRSIAAAAAALTLTTGTVTAGVVELPSPAAAGSVSPNLFAAADSRVYLSWIERRPEGRHALRFAVREGRGWSRPRIVAEGADWFVNWADFPSVVALPDGTLAAHWLVRSAKATYAYDTKISRSADGGATWTAPVTPHRDATPTEHGFASLFPARDGLLAAAWLDGRNMQSDGVEGDHGSGAMTLRYAAVGPGGNLQDETLLDGRVCDCCQTSAAVTRDGPVLVFRDRSPEEVRDIAIVRLRGGAWSKPAYVAQDGWRIGGCPVNGPAVAADGRQVAVAWFTAANDVPRVKLAFSGDAGASFGAPAAVDDGRPLGRVDAVLLDDGSAVVSWVESAPEGLSLRLRRIRPDGSRSGAVIVVPAGEKLANAFPQLARGGDGSLVIAWTADRVRTATVTVPALPRSGAR